jgi:hypothetical protein
MIAMTSLIGSVPASAVPVAPASAVELDTDLTLVMPSCEGCVITLASVDGLNAPYFSVPATVTEGTVTFTLPSARTSGLSVKVQPTYASTTGPATYVAWRYNGKSIGSSVSFRAAKGKVRASGCWAGTINAAVALTIKVRQVSQGGRTTAIAWAPVTESFLSPMQRARGGVLSGAAAPTCNTMR